MQVDPTGNGDWMTFAEYPVEAGKTITNQLPAQFQARWIRFSSDKDTNATAWLDYQ